MKILITGGGGLLGQYLNIELSGKNDILSIYHKNPGNSTNYKNVSADITNNQQLEKIFNDFKPDIVIHNAAVSSPKMAAALNPKLVYDINVNASKSTAELCERFKSKLIYTSTDLVYAGYRGSMLKEDAKLIPITLYAETKLMGEIKIQETFNNYLILRVALLFGFGLNHSKNHFGEMYENFRNNKRVKLFYDQYRTPISLKEAAKIINQLCDFDIKGEVINLGGKDRVSRLELGELLCDAAGFDKSLIDKISMNEIEDIPMAADVSLNTDKLQSYGIKLKSIDDSVREVIKEFNY
ncbi:MAG TPA: sugar nucleotide-binding protein [Mariniphaga sp.]|nr:sugar nucleotide-binding protein [Mariniphaga sp.]